LIRSITHKINHLPVSQRFDGEEVLQQQLHAYETQRDRLGLLGLFIYLAALKLSRQGLVAGWSWWWVTTPLWAPWALLVLSLAWAWLLVYLRRSFLR
jgi:fatty acid desaturase